MPFPLANLGGWFGGTFNTIITPFYILFALNATYCFTTGRNVRNHERAAKSSANKRQRVQDMIRNDRLNGLTETTSTSNWLRRADRAISEKAANRQRYNQRRKIVGCHFLNFLENYKISKQAVKKLEDVKECDLSTPPLDTVTESRPAPPMVDLPIQSAQLTPRRKVIVAEALKFIKADNTVGVIGMWGPDKVEKTQLLTQINNSFTGRFFDFVIFVTASSECSAQHIQAQIIRRLGIKQHDDVATQATRISELLCKKNFLVLVDDLCGQLDLRAVGIPYPLGVVTVPCVCGQLKRKVVITSPSRSKSIHSLMGVDKDIEVPRLEENGALQLFNQYFGAQEDLYSDPNIVRKLKLREDGNLEAQRCIIFEFLKTRSFLVLLDDLWDRIDLEAVGITYPLGTEKQLKRKVVLTTRSVNVCGQMEVRKDLKVAYMQEDEAWQLFQEKVGRETLSSSPRIEALAKELVKELRGLPLALITIGRAMYAKTCTAKWEYAIQCMRQSCYDKDDPLGMEKAVFSQLRFSYDSLSNETLRHCFCIFALWPEDHKIRKEELAQCWIGLGLVEVDELDIQSYYKKAYSLTGNLTDACLIDGREEWISMHDVVRDMALWIFSENNDSVLFVKELAQRKTLVSLGSKQNTSH